MRGALKTLACWLLGLATVEPDPGVPLVLYALGGGWDVAFLAHQTAAEYTGPLYALRCPTRRKCWVWEPRVRGVWADSVCAN